MTDREKAAGASPDPIAAPGEIAAASATDTGRVRQNNEDYVIVGDLDADQLVPPGDPVASHAPSRGLLFVVCDGMGGVAGGEIASELAAQAMWAAMRDAAPTRDVSIFARHLRRGVRAANQLVHREAGERGPRGMGTTLSAAGTAGSTLVIAHVGDSRVYVERCGVLSQVTRDQSVVSALTSAGRMSEHEAAMSPSRGSILQALGVRDDVEVSLSLAELRRGDRVLLCSDGLHGVVSKQAIRTALGSVGDPRDVKAAASELISIAMEAGAPDNVSAIVAHFDGEGLEPPAGEANVPFVELDPFAEGDRALSETSRVARRLAARAGLRDDEVGTSDIVATRQRLVWSSGEDTTSASPAPAKPTTIDAPPPGPATDALAARSRLGLATWIAAALAAAVVAFVLWGVTF